ncbi:MAG: Hsp20/alpha crystallin family protein [Candidatus Altiarchaeales archaeon]|nr:MAG: Hsp20/alpha crystallin family protein [Candidatus Altiarchaeales archaeon]
MFPWRRRWSWDEFFRDLDEEFKEMEENIARIFDEAKRMSLKEPEKGGPYVYGFSMRIGPEGKPKIEEFGNIPGIVSGRMEIPRGREPLTDIIEGDKEISVIVELPGVEKEDIDLNIGVDSLEIDVDTPKRKYHKRLSLPCEVKPEKARATYKNGVLEVKIERVKERKKKEWARIKVE